MEATAVLIYVLAVVVIGVVGCTLLLLLLLLRLYSADILTLHVARDAGSQ